MIPIGEILLIIGGMIILYCIAGVIHIFIDTHKHCNEIENKSFQYGKNTNEEKLKKEIELLKNTKTKFNSFKRLEISCKLQGLKKALREKIAN